jgi:predicted secreted protein
MYWTSALAIYVIFWFFCLFLVLPFHARRQGEIDRLPVAGQADSAPVTFSAARVALQTTLVAGALFALYYVNYEKGWLTRDDINFFPPPPEVSRSF